MNEVVLNTYLLWDAYTHDLVQDAATEIYTSMIFTVVCLIKSPRIFGVKTAWLESYVAPIKMLETSQHWQFRTQLCGSRSWGIVLKMAPQGSVPKYGF